jgi:hypothetical protein
VVGTVVAGVVSTGFDAVVDVSVVAVVAVGVVAAGFGFSTGFGFGTGFVPYRTTFGSDR